MINPDNKIKISPAPASRRSAPSPRTILTHSAPWSFQRRHETLGFSLVASILGPFSLYGLRALENPVYLLSWACLFSISYLSFRFVLFSVFENTWTEHLKLFLRIFLGWGITLFTYLNIFQPTLYYPLSSESAGLKSFLSIPLVIWFLSIIFKKTRPLLNSVRIRAVVVGVTPVGTELYNRSQSSIISDLNIVGFFDFRREPRIHLPIGATFLDTPEELAKHISSNHIDLVIITLPMRQEERILELMELLSDTTASVAFVPDIFQFDLMNSSLGELSGIPVITLRDTPFYGWKRTLKRTMDLLLSTLLLIGLSPLFLLIGFIIKVSSPGPVFFRQKRVGLGTKPLGIWKFRSMFIQQPTTYPKPAEQSDPRITPFGKWLRRYSLDELPQLLNVFQGTMSLVGPRPFAWEHSEHYRDIIQGYSLRHKVKPGMTGWAQINGHRGLIENTQQLKSRVEYDLYYVKHWSLFFDFIILLKSIHKVFVGDDRAF